MERACYAMTNGNGCGCLLMASVLMLGLATLIVRCGSSAPKPGPIPMADASAVLGPLPPPNPEPDLPPITDEMRAWALAESERDSCEKPTRALDCYHTQRYLDSYPLGLHAQEAKRRVDAVKAKLAYLKSAEPPTPEMPSPPVESGGGFLGGRRRHRRH